MTNRNRVSTISPRGTSLYPRLNAPDTKYAPEGKYSVKLKLAGNDANVQAWVAKLEKIRDDFFDAEVERLTAEKKRALAMELTKEDVVKIERDQETGEETGFLLITASMKASGTRKDGSTWTQKPTIFDAKGTELKNPPAIWGGTEMKVGMDVEAFVNQTSKKVCLSTRLTAAQILKLVSGGQRSFGAMGFQAEDGDEIEDGTAPPFGDESGASGDANDDL
jgi:hypothetical protein